MKLTKREAQIIHAKKRFLQRHGRNLDDTEYKILVNLIKNNKSKCIRKVSNDYFIHEIQYQKETLYVVYNKSRHTIVTFLLYSELEVKEIEMLNEKGDMFRTKNLEIQKDFEKFNLEYLEKMENFKII